MSTKIDKPHVLVVEEIDGDTEWRIVHPPTCRWDAYRCVQCLDPIFDPAPADRPHLHFHRSCLIQWEIDSNGIDGLGVNDPDHIDPDYVPLSKWEADWHKLKSGRYIVKMTYSWTGSWYDEPDSEFWIECVA